MRIVNLVFLAFLTASVIPISAKDQGFSGKWVLDKNQDPPDGPKNLETHIKQDGNGMTLESTFREPDDGIVPLLYLGVMTTKMHLSFTGDTAQNQIGPFQIASKTSLNGNQMDTEWTAVVKGDQVQGHWTHKLADDGKHMTLDIKETVGQGPDAQATLHFVRK